MSSDNFIRCFSPYDCDQPRVLIHAGELTGVCMSCFYDNHNSNDASRYDVATRLPQTRPYQSFQISVQEITRVEALSQKFLDRFHLFEVRSLPNSGI